ncbi:MAG: peptidoglycan-binding protein, partial [Candidatus Omnitrophica bacterium]|nr:peptidoglycan-binding protein [Candidatus Omnitrophota bacterium]
MFTPLMAAESADIKGFEPAEPVATGAAPAGGAGPPAGPLSPLAPGSVEVGQPALVTTPAQDLEDIAEQLLDEDQLRKIKEKLPVRFSGSMRELTASVTQAPGTVRELQIRLVVDDDGVLGHGTVKALRTYLLLKAAEEALSTYMAGPNEAAGKALAAAFKPLRNYDPDDQVDRNLRAQLHFAVKDLQYGLGVEADGRIGETVTVPALNKALEKGDMDIINALDGLHGVIESWMPGFRETAVPETTEALKAPEAPEEAEAPEAEKLEVKAVRPAPEAVDTVSSLVKEILQIEDLNGALKFIKEHTEFKPVLDSVRDLVITVNSGEVVSRGWWDRIEVGQVQRSLEGLDYSTGEHKDPAENVDQKFGKNTEEAVEQFQKDRGLISDGRVDPGTLAHLIKAGLLKELEDLRREADRTRRVTEETGRAAELPRGVDIAGEVLDMNGAVVEKTGDTYRVIKAGHPLDYTYETKSGRLADPQGEPMNIVKFAATSDSRTWIVEKPLAVAVRHVKRQILGIIPVGVKEERHLIMGSDGFPEGTSFMRGDEKVDISEMAEADSVVMPDEKGREVRYDLLRPYAVMYADAGKGKIDFTYFMDGLSAEGVKYYSSDPSSPDAREVDPVRGVFPDQAVSADGTIYQYAGNPSGLGLDAGGNIIGFYTGEERIPEGSVTNMAAILRGVALSGESRVRDQEVKLAFAEREEAAKSSINPVKAYFGPLQDLQGGGLSWGAGIEGTLFDNDPGFAGRGRYAMVSYLRQKFAMSKSIKDRLFSAIIACNDYFKAIEQEQKIRMELAAARRSLDRLKTEEVSTLNRKDAEARVAGLDASLKKAEAGTAGVLKAISVIMGLGYAAGFEIMGDGKIDVDLVNGVLEKSGIDPADFWRDYYGPMKRLDIALSDAKKAKELAASKPRFSLGVIIGYPYVISPKISISKGPDVAEPLHEIRREIQVSDEKELSRNRSYQLQELRILEDFCSGMEKDLPVLIGSLAK